MFLPAVLIPACDSFSSGFHMRYSAYKLNKQGDNIQACHTPFLILNQSVVPCLIPTVASWSTYRFIRRQVRWSATPISLRIFQFVCVIHTYKGFSVVNEAEVDVFLELPCFLHDPKKVDNLISGSTLCFLNPTCTSEKSQFMYSWNLAWRILSITLLAYDMSTSLQ